MPACGALCHRQEDRPTARGGGCSGQVGQEGTHGSPGRVVFLWQSQPRRPVVTQLSPTSCTVLSERHPVAAFLRIVCVLPVLNPGGGHTPSSGFTKNCSFICLKTTLLTAKSHNET